MPGKFYDTEEFKKLNKEWSEKLKASGFEDIEQDEDHLKVWSKRQFEIVGPAGHLLNQSKEAYYRMASEFLHTYKFPDDKVRAIWEMHSEGLSYREIMNKLTYKINKNSIWKTVKQIQELMFKKYGIKKS